jgi:hypothetical protein
VTVPVKDINVDDTSSGAISSVIRSAQVRSSEPHVVIGLAIPIS